MVERRARMKRTVRQATLLWCGVLAHLSHRTASAAVTLRTDAGETADGLGVLGLTRTRRELQSVPDALTVVA